MDSWNFDAFAVAELAPRPLTWVATIVSQKYQFAARLSVPADVLDSLFRELNDGYHAENPYHNAIHAADVVQACHYFLSTCM